MYIQNKPRWQIKENQVTNEKLYLNRRKFIKNSSSILGSTSLLYNFLSKDLNATQNNENILNIDELKKIYLKERLSVKKKFFSNYSGIENSKQNSNLIDKIIKKIFFILNKKNKKNFENFSVTAVGGYGRKQLAPYSDIDLLFIYNSKDLEEIEKLVKEFLYPLWDLGLKVGYAVRSLKESIIFSEKDHIIKTTMLDVRLICGSKNLFDKLLKNYFKKIKENKKKFIKEKIKEREQRIKAIGFDYFRNEPNLKGSEGSLRDLNLINWCMLM